MRNRLPLLFASLAAILPACAFEDPAPSVPGTEAPEDFNVVVHVHPGKADVDTQHYAVQFLDKDGKLVRETATQADGTARAKIEAGATVIVIGGPAAKQVKPKTPKDQTPPLAPGGPFAVKAVMGLQPGDDIELDLAPPAAAPDAKSAVGKFTYAVKPMTGATKYLVADPCAGGFVQATITDGAASFPAAFNVFKSCVGKKVSLIAFAYDADGLIGWSKSDEIELKIDAGAPMAAAWSAASTLDAQVTGLDSSIDGVSVARTSASGQAAALPAGKPTGSSFDGSLVVTADSSAAVQTKVTAGANHTQYIEEAVAGDLSTYKLDLATKLLPWVDASTFDLAAGTLHTPLRGTGAYDAFEATITLSRTETITFTDRDEDKNDRTNTYTYPLAISWTVITDKAGDVTLPKLVGDLAQYNPQATAPATTTVKDSGVHTTTVTAMTADTAAVEHARIVDVQEADGYDGVRQGLYGDIDRAEGTGANPDVTKDHGVRTSVYR